ncbi:MAG: ArnT family glycosyltransferase [Anaerolineae bacterium]
MMIQITDVWALMRRHGLFMLVLALSVPIKIMTAHNLPWDIDIVPVVARNTDYLLTPVGTLSSVAAYNLPMLSWLHLPAQWLTGNVWWTIMLTMLGFNLLSTTALYALGLAMFDRRVALIGATLFTFSEVGVSSSYTAWAQLLLPGFFAMTFLCLWLWIDRQRGVWLALAGIVATMAFMTHFSALLLYPAMLVIALLTRAKWQWRWLLVGAGAVFLMFLPYLRVQIERDFADVRAFARQQVLVDADVMAQYEIYKPGYRSQPAREPLNPPESIEQVTEDLSEAGAIESLPDVRPEPPPHWQRALDYAWQSPRWYWQALTYAFKISTPTLSTTFPILAPMLTLFYGMREVLMLLCIGAVSLQVIRQRQHPAVLTCTPAGRWLLLLIANLTIITLMILTRTINNSSYWTGLMSLQFLMIAYSTTLLPHRRTVTVGLLLVMIAYMGLQSGERVLRIMQHDDDSFSPYNIAIYRHVEATVDYIAQDWQGGDAVTINYDIIEDANYLWWVPAWHSIDPSYRMGMNFDFLLSYHHGIENRNLEPLGRTEPADYIIVYTPSLDQYDLTQYSSARFGSIVVLKPH